MEIIKISDEELKQTKEKIIKKEALLLDKKMLEDELTKINSLLAYFKQ